MYKRYRQIHFVGIGGIRMSGNGERLLNLRDRPHRAPPRRGAGGAPPGKAPAPPMGGAVLAEGRYDPTIVVGGRVTSLGSNARLGQGDYPVAEAAESDGSLPQLAPT